MLSPRFAWTLGALLTVAMAVRLVGWLPADEEDRALARMVAQVQHEVRARYVDEITPAKLKQMQAAAIGGMLSTLDPHTIYVPLQQKAQFNTILNGNFIGVGLKFSVTPAGEVSVETPIEGGPAYAAGIEAGDVFVKVNGQPVAGLTTSALHDRIVGEPGTSVTLTMRRYDNSFKDFVVERRQINLPTVLGYQRNADGSWDWFADRSAGIAYIRIAQFNEETADRVRDALLEITRQGGKGVIVDVRFNGGGRLEEATTIADFFLDEGTIVTVKGRTRTESTTLAKKDDTLFRGPLAILVNGDSASASEILAGALADHRRAAVVGSRTFGKGSVQEVEDWGDEGLLKITTAKWLLPSGKSLQRTADGTTWGVDPTIRVDLSPQEEEALDQALAEPVPIPPQSHATTRPVRAPDRQLDVAVKAVATQLFATTAPSGN
jgi:carboxyl-terminal processing protease